MMNDFFVEQTILDETNATLPPNIDHPENNLNFISTSPYEVESILKSLQLGKASGPDKISNHILKKLHLYLLLLVTSLIFLWTLAKIPYSEKRQM